MFILVTLFISNFSIGQTLKTFNGKYDNGNAIYQYYENADYERIMQGNFTYSENKFQITGQFLNNKRNGIWKSTNTYKMGWNSTSDIVTETCIANYLEGKLNGQCTYKKVNLTTNKILINSSAYFKRNILSGNFEFNSINDRFETENDFSIKFYTNNEGYIDSTFKINFSYNKIKYELIRKYKTGFLTWELSRNLSTGEILNKIDNKNIIDNFYKFFDIKSHLSLMPYIEFPESAEPCYVSYVEIDQGKNIAKEIYQVPVMYKLSRKVNRKSTNESDTVFLKNAPFTFINKTFTNLIFPTEMEVINFPVINHLNNSLSFWFPNNSENPLYKRVHIGADGILFYPEKLLLFDDQIYQKNLIKKDDQ